MKKIRLSSLITATVILFIVACKKPAETPEPENPLANYNNGNGVFIVNEGGYLANNSSVSFLNKTNNAIIDNLYGISNNNVSQGDVTQSMTIHNGKGYIVVNNSRKVEVVNINNFTKFTTLTGFSAPRYLFVVDANKAYISDWISDEVKILDLNTNTISGSITTGSGPEQMVKIGNSVYVANNGGYGDDSTITVINATTNAVTATIQTALKPVSMKFDKNNNLWVLCSGSYGTDYVATTDDTPAKLVMIDPSTNAVVQSFVIGSLGNHPNRLAINKTNDILYYAGNNLNVATENNVYKFAIADVATSAVPFISKAFYGLDVDPVTDVIYGSDAKDYQVKGEIFRYTNAGVLIDNYKVGVAPSGFVFN